MPNPPTGDPNQHDPTTFTPDNPLSGTCLCGSITVTIHDAELFARPRGHLCHCANCRKVAGSYVASNLLLDAAAVTIADRDATLTRYDDYATLSGNPVHRFFCSRDGNPIKSETAAYPGKVILKTGLLPRIPQPEAEAFGLHRHPWQGRHEGVPTYKIKWAGPERELME